MIHDIQSLFLAERVSCHEICSPTAGKPFRFINQPEVQIMSTYLTMTLPAQMDARAPDGAEVRLLPTLEGRGGMAHFALPAGQVSRAVTHRTVEEIWYFIAGHGKMWRKQGGHSEIVDVFPGVALTIPLGTRFQFRSDGAEPLAAIGVTMPPWPGEGEAVVVEGIWEPNLPA